MNAAASQHCEFESNMILGHGCFLAFVRSLCLILDHTHYILFQWMLAMDRLAFSTPLLEAGAPRLTFD